MKRIKWQNPVTLTAITGEPMPLGDANPMPFEGFLFQRLTNPIFGQSSDMAKASARMRKAILATVKSGGRYLAVRNDDYVWLKLSVETYAYNAAILHNFVGFMDAVLDARDWFSRRQTGSK